MRNRVYGFIILTLLLGFLLDLHAGAGSSPSSSDMTSRLPGTAVLEENDANRLKVREIARSLIGKNGPYLYLNGKKYTNDCSGMVRAVFDAIGIDLFAKSSSYPAGTNGVEIIYKSYRNKSWSNFDRIPKTGDLIIFNNTYDKNGNTRWDDKFTHVSVITGVEENGTVVYIHHVSKGIQRYRMNLEKREIYSEDGVRYNDYLRRRPSSDNDRNKYLSSNLFYVYIDVLGSRGK